MSGKYLSDHDIKASSNSPCKETRCIQTAHEASETDLLHLLVQKGFALVHRCSNCRIERLRLSRLCLRIKVSC